MKTHFAREELKIMLAKMEGKILPLAQGLSPTNADAVFNRRRKEQRLADRIRTYLR